MLRSEEDHVAPAALTREQIKEAIAELDMGLLQERVIMAAVNALSTKDLAAYQWLYAEFQREYQANGIDGARAFLEKHETPKPLIEVVIKGMQVAESAE